ncbi:MAG: DoxX family protein [Ignavibacteria bacterium]|nr:DoxX family protein [Ignavibacteria bacterium]
MGIFFKSKGNLPIGILLIRLTIGSMFLFMGARKLLELEAYVNYTKQLGIFSENLSFIIGFIYPFLEILFGSLYLLGFMTPLASLSIAVITIVKLLAFGGRYPLTDAYGFPFSFNFLILACAITTLFSGAGVISFDVFLERKKDKTRRKISIAEEVMKSDSKESQPSDKENTTDAKFEDIKETAYK